MTEDNAEAMRRLVSVPQLFFPSLTFFALSVNLPLFSLPYRSCAVSLFLVLPVTVFEGNNQRVFQAPRRRSRCFDLLHNIAVLSLMFPISDPQICHLQYNSYMCL